MIDSFVLLCLNFIPHTGRGARPSRVGQVGLRCVFCTDLPKCRLSKQARCYPLKGDSIFESIRNYQRTHIPVCTRMPHEVKMEYITLNSQSRLQKRSQRYLKAYYAETASELGIVDTKDGGLEFGKPPNTSGAPSETLQGLIDVANDESTAESFWTKYSAENATVIPSLRKFEHVASESTRNVIIDARAKSTILVSTEDFATVSDFEYLLFHQVVPFTPSVQLVQSCYDSNADVVKLNGFTCKHCAKKGDTRNHFPADLKVIADTNYLHRMYTHFVQCHHAPVGLRDAIQELKRLTKEHDIVVKRGSRKRFLSKVWRKFRKFYSEQLNSCVDTRGTKLCYN